MSEFHVVLGAVVPVFLITGAGFVLRRLAWLTEEADQSLLRLTINLLFPCLVLHSAMRNPALREWQNLALAPAVGLATFGLGLIAAKVASRFAKLDNEAARRTFTLSVGLYNYGFVPIPLALLLFGQHTVGVLFVHNVGVELGLWTAGVMVLAGARTRVGWRNLINAPLVAIVLALVLNFSGAGDHLPAVVDRTIAILAECAIPLSLILAGATMDDHLEEFHTKPAWGTMAMAVLLRIVLLPMVFLALAKLLPASLELKRVIVLQAAMPSAVFPIVMAKHYAGDPPTALRVVLGTSIVGLITIPLWIRLGLAWLSW
ncbi:MAG: AEC family transporter [Verrucomicrobiia bacterium]